MSQGKYDHLDKDAWSACWNDATANANSGWSGIQRLMPYADFDITQLRLAPL